MARLVEIIIPGYKPIYKYEEYILVEGLFSEFVVFVNNITDFREGLRDSYNNAKTMTKQQVKQAKTMSVTKETEHGIGHIVYSELLKSNDFELLPL